MPGAPGLLLSLILGGALDSLQGPRKGLDVRTPGAGDRLRSMAEGMYAPSGGRLGCIKIAEVDV